MIYQHPPEKVVTDITNGGWDIGEVEWCRACGAYRVFVYCDTKGWVLPELELPKEPLKE